MSVVVAIKENNTIYMGSDSQVTRGGSRTTLRNKNNYKIWKVEGANNCLMGHVGNLRDGNVVRLLDDLVSDYNEFKGHVGFRFVVKKVVPEIIEALKEAGYLRAQDNFFEGMESRFLFAYQDQLFLIGGDGSVIEIEDYVAIGSGENEAIGSLHSTQGLSARERIIMAIKASSASDIYVDYPIILSDTESTSFDVITEKNEKLYIDVLNSKLKETKNEVK